jgi:transcriptional regulator with XRE-family HTH domain
MAPRSAPATQDAQEAVATGKSDGPGPPAVTERLAKAHVASIGRLVAARRRGRYSVQDLAARSGVSAGLISQLERGLGNPSFATLMRLASALDLEIGDFFERPSRPPDVFVPAGGRMRLVLGGGRLTYELLTPDFHRRLAVLRTTLPVGWENSATAFVHAGEEVVHLLSGQIEAHVGPDLYLMNVGDTITFDCGQVHWWQNVGRDSAQLIVSMTPPLL